MSNEISTHPREEAFGCVDRRLGLTFGFSVPQLRLLVRHQEKIWLHVKGMSWRQQNSIIPGTGRDTVRGI